MVNQRLNPRGSTAPRWHDHMHRDLRRLPARQRDLERTAAFYFSDPSDAYASRTGRPDDLGVIGVALFREREDRWLYSQERDSVASPAPRAESSRIRACRRRSLPGR